MSMDLISFDQSDGDTEPLTNGYTCNGSDEMLNDDQITDKSENQPSESSPTIIISSSDETLSTTTTTPTICLRPRSFSSNSVTSTSCGTTTLSGYFNKLGIKGGIRSYKRRWFTFDDQSGKLIYYRDPEEPTPLDSVDIRKATFSLHPQFKDSSFIIKISNDKPLLLETNDRSVALHWFDTLQTLRKKYIMDDDLNSKSSRTNQLVTKENTNNNTSSSRLDPSNGSVFYDTNVFVGRECSPIPSKSDLEPTTESKPSNRLSVFGRIRSRSSYLVSGRKESNKSSSSTNGCNQCSEYESNIVNLHDDLNAVENELEASREVIKVLQLQLEAAVREKESLVEICKSHTIPEQMIHTLSQREKELTLNESRLRQSENNIEKLTQESQRLTKEKENTKEELNLMKELIHVKDQTVMSLTNKIYDLEKKQKDEFAHNEWNNIRKVDQDELESLKDSVNAYQLQNKCLNKEIIALNDIRHVLEKKQQELQLKCYDWEARCCQIHSKLLSLLKELNQTIEMSENADENDQQQLISSNQSVKALVTRLLDENSLDIPLSWKPGNRKRSDEHATSSGTDLDYDELGFSLKQSDCEIEFGDKLSGKSEAFNKIKKANDPTNQSEAGRQQFEWKYRWDYYIGNLGSNELSRNLELKVLLRTGVPQEYRCKIWRMLINIRIRNLKDRLGSGYYQTLCVKTVERKVNPAAKQIELDLLRTLPNNKHFENIKSPGIMRLRQVLTCYSLHNPAVGYCQGMNRLAAVALLFMPEEDAFWTLVAIIENIMPPDYFTANLLGAHVDQYVLRDLLTEKLPNLNSHLERHGIELSLFSWFLTCFVDNVPSNIYLRIWDVFLYEGNKVLFRFALAFLKYHSSTILTMNDSLTINQYIRLLGYRTIDVDHLCHISFNLLNPFRMSKVKAKRLHYTQLVTSELNKLDTIRKTLPAHENNDNSDSD
ncbi:TBC1 domain family member 2B-like [Panonychus citri]|uniref:TBC1 domain family member 2B-like n=1 Tax=Panonychus citri TaxID=50023 RepID=UPI00230710A7|nr:TBC1 domain family member 2B-like [Panonychus citri]XP_053212563.1 TBC1 domain family member 2B-like [Panonychus citri]XP_053212564.1 TBC1 domain family member 2B-like [Panonychus citri]